MSHPIFHGNCIDIIKELIEQGIQVDSIVTDPPYELGFMNKDWDKTGIAYNKELWSLCLQILKPGGHLVSFGGSRTYHRMACAIEDAGFQIRDQIMWLYGSGFPKSLDISKAIDKAQGAEREKIKYDAKEVGNFKNRDDTRPWIEEANLKGFHLVDNNTPITDDAKQWQGWGTALKPAHEPIVLARKPLDAKTIAANVLEHGTGAINIDRCRIGNEQIKTKGKNCFKSWGRDFTASEAGLNTYHTGRYPANLIHDGSDEIEAEFYKYGESKSSNTLRKNTAKAHNKTESMGKSSSDWITHGHADKGTASRFYYCAKASKKERNGSKHPTVKPLALMRYLCRLITPPGGTILDPFAGSGTTGQAAIDEGFETILIEQNPEYINDIKKRLDKSAYHF